MSDLGSTTPLASTDLLVVRTTLGWNLTPAERREALPIGDPAMHALVRASGGTPVPDDGAERAELEAAGIDLAAVASAAEAGTEPTGRSTWISPTEWPAPPLDAVVAPLEAFVAQVAAGCLLVEGLGGERYTLDDVDLTLVEAVTDKTTVGAVIEAVTGRLGVDAPPRDELGGRLRRLGEAGRLDLRIPLPVEPAPAPAPEPSVEEEPVEEPDPPLTLASGLTSTLRRAQYPGRRYVAKGYRGLRRVRRGVRARLAARHPQPVVDEVVEPVAPVEEMEVPTPAPTVDVADTPAVEADSEGERFEAISDVSPDEIIYLESPSVEPVAEGAIPVYAVFEVETGPALSLAMLTACARRYNDGVLNEHFEIRRVEDPASFFADLETRTGPAMLLLSNYTWSFDHNMDVARRAKAMHPELVIVHGGPSTPKYEAACEEFFHEHGDLIDIAVRGEGEITMAEILLALSATHPVLDLSVLADVEGLTFRNPEDGRIIRTGDRDRVMDLETLPSPYLTGEYDHLHPSAWGADNRLLAVILETNRGCPYGCTFCDWGSSTLSRIRKFDLDRVEGEMAWAASHGHPAWVLADANYGIMSRDVEVTERLVKVRSQFGQPSSLGFNVAKNTTKHLTAIVDQLVDAGVVPHFTLALQSRDEDTLEAVERTNISTDHYVSLAASFRRRGLPLQADLMLGLPGQTVDSMEGDLQFLIEHEIPARMWITQSLPNAPLNDPEYRERWKIESDSRSLILSTASFTREDRDEMLRMRHVYTVFERFGMLRHVMRLVQWDHGLPAMTLMRRLIDVSRDDPHRYPLLNWVVRYFDFFNVPPLGWRSFMNEVRRFLVNEFDIPLTSALDCVLDLQAFLLPEFGRRFPATLPLAHDYVAYYEDKTHNLWLSGHSEPPDTPLSEYGPGTVTVYADPLNRCTSGLAVYSDPRNETMAEDFWLSGQWELDSPLVRPYAEVSAEGSFLGIHEQKPTDLPEDIDDEPTSAVRVQLARSALATAGTDRHDPSD